MPTKTICLLLACSIFALGRPAYGQSKTGTTVAQFLLIEPSARAAAMGNTGVAMYDEVIAAYYNPAAIGQQSQHGLQFTHSLWLADIRYDYAAAVIQAGGIGNFFFSFTSLNSGEIAVRTVEQPLGTGERYTVSNLALGLGYGRQLSDRFSLGLQLSFIQETIWHSSFQTFAVNVGTVYRLSENGPRLGASISNFGMEAGYSGTDLRIRYDLNPDIYGDNSSLPGEVFTEEYSLPVMFRVGLSWPVHLNKNNQLLFAVDAYHPNDNTESMSLGAEWTLFNVLALRGGYQNLRAKDFDSFTDLITLNPTNENRDSEAGLTLGAGLNVDIENYVFRLDYSWGDYGRLENTQRFSLGFSF